MRKIIAIGRCGLDIIMDGATPVCARPGGRIPNAAASLAAIGRHVSMVGEAGRDMVGDMVVGFLDRHGVDTRSVDRFTEGLTPTSLLFTPSGDTVDYPGGPDGEMDVVWPRIDRDDILIFGGYYAIDPRVRRRLYEIVAYAREREAIIIYLPGFNPREVTRITKVMPAIFENLELSDIAVTRPEDIKTIFGTGDAAHAWRDHLSFYLPAMLHADYAKGEVSLSTPSCRHACRAIPDNGIPRLDWDAAVVAGIAESLLKEDILYRNIADIGQPLLDNIARHLQQHIENPQK